MHVLIVGAGLAGLTAAHELAREQIAVTLLEARDRTGGRVWTRRDRFAHGQHAELGGEFVDEGHRRMRALAGRFSLDLVPVLPTGFTHRYSVDGAVAISRSRPWDALAEAFAPLVHRYRLARGRFDADSVRELATWSVTGWLNEQRAAPGLHAIARILRGFFLADPEELSALPLVAQIADEGPPSKVRVFRIAGGAARLIDALAASTPMRLLLRHRLVGIAQAADRVVARFLDADGRQDEITGDAIVVAAPASTLADVTMTPSLPVEQERAIRGLRYGCATKAAIQYTGTGLHGRRAQAFATDTGLGAFWDATDGQPAAPTSVIHLLGGGAASASLRSSIEGGGASVMRQLCWLGLANMPVVASHWTDWSADPFARGGYAFFDPGFDPAWRPLLARRHGRLIFAGEHTSEDWQGYMEGAMESGIRAAHEILTRR